MKYYPTYKDSNINWAMSILLHGKFKKLNMVFFLDREGHGELIQQIMNLIVRALELLTLIMLICAFWIENILFVTIQQLR